MRNIKMVDTHAHLYDAQFENDIDDVISRAIASGIDKMFLPNCDSSTIDGMMGLAEKFPDNCFPMMGIHPCYIKENYKEELKTVSDWLSKYRFAAVGEIGLDYYWDKTFVMEQKEAFRLQIDMALAHSLPIVIHSRDATQECIDIVKEKQNGKLKGVFHCFGDGIEMAQKIIDLGFLLGIGGVVTFKNSPLPEVVKNVDLKHIVLETDAPYLAPMPYRGKRNESSYIAIIAQKIAEIKNVTLEEVAEKTTIAAQELFG